MSNWNTQEFFDTCLQHFSEIPAMRANIADDAATNERFLLFTMARVGFGTFTDRKNWTPATDEFIARFVDSDLTPESMKWFEETAAAVAAFACFAYGALAGRYVAGELDHGQFEVGVWHLPGYYFGHTDEIYETYIKGVGGYENDGGHLDVETNDLPEVPASTSSDTGSGLKRWRKRLAPKKR